MRNLTKTGCRSVGVMQRAASIPGVQQTAKRVALRVFSLAKDVLRGPINVNIVNNHTPSSSTSATATEPPKLVPTPGSWRNWMVAGGVVSAATMYVVYRYRNEVRRWLGGGTNGRVLATITHIGHGQSGILILDTHGEIEGFDLSLTAKKLAEYSSQLIGLEVEVLFKAMDVPSGEEVAARFIDLQKIEAASYDSVSDAQLDSLIFYGTIPGDEDSFWKWIGTNHFGWLLLRLLIVIIMNNLQSKDKPEVLPSYIRSLKVVNEQEKKLTTSYKSGNLWRYVLVSAGVSLSDEQLFHHEELVKAFQLVQQEEAYGSVKRSRVERKR